MDDLFRRDQDNPFTWTAAERHAAAEADVHRRLCEGWANPEGLTHFNTVEEEIAWLDRADKDLEQTFTDLHRAAAGGVPAGICLENATRAQARAGRHLFQVERMRRLVLAQEGGGGGLDFDPAHRKSVCEAAVVEALARMRHWGAQCLASAQIAELERVMRERVNKRIAVCWPPQSKPPKRARAKPKPASESASNEADDVDMLSGVTPAAAPSLPPGSYGGWPIRSRDGAKCETCDAVFDDAQAMAEHKDRLGDHSWPYKKKKGGRQRSTRRRRRRSKKRRKRSRRRGGAEDEFSEFHDVPEEYAQVFDGRDFPVRASTPRGRIMDDLLLDLDVDRWERDVIRRDFDDLYSADYQNRYGLRQAKRGIKKGKKSIKKHHQAIYKQQKMNPTMPKHATKRRNPWTFGLTKRRYWKGKRIKGGRRTRRRKRRKKTKRRR